MFVCLCVRVFFCVCVCEGGESGWWMDQSGHFLLSPLCVLRVCAFLENDDDMAVGMRLALTVFMKMVDTCEPTLCGDAIKSIRRLIVDAPVLSLQTEPR